jgi:hypothetical protein
MATTIFDTIRDAIINKKIVTARYHGFNRVMCPHVIGWNKRGEEQALFYQFAGQSSSGLAPPGSGQNWRCIPLAGLSGVQISDGDWQTAPNHSRPQSCVHLIDTEVSY